LQILYTRWETDDLTMPPLATKRKEIRHFFEGDRGSHRSKKTYSLVTPNTRRITMFLFPPVEDVRNCCDYPELPRGYRCWTLELDVESKEDLPPLGTEILIGEVHEAIAFY
jgi:hypothetical protein